MAINEKLYEMAMSLSYEELVNIFLISSNRREFVQNIEKKYVSNKSDADAKQKADSECPVKEESNIDQALEYANIQMSLREIDQRIRRIERIVIATARSTNAITN